MAEVDSFSLGSSMQFGPSHMTPIEERANITEEATIRQKPLRRLTKRREESREEENSDPNHPLQENEDDGQLNIGEDKKDEDYEGPELKKTKGKKENQARKIKKIKSTRDTNPEAEFINDKDEEEGEKNNEKKKEKAKKALGKNKEMARINTDEIFEKLKSQPGFIIEEEEDEDNENSQRMEADENGNSRRLISMKGEFKVPRELDRKRSTTASTNPNIIKTKNKFFNEIDTMEHLHREPDCSEEGMLLDEGLDGEKDIVVQDRNKKKKDLSNFMQKLNKFREDRAIVSQKEDFSSNSNQNLISSAQSENLGTLDEASIQHHAISQPLMLNEKNYSEEVSKSQCSFNMAESSHRELNQSAATEELPAISKTSSVAGAAGINFKKEEFNGLLKRTFSTNVEDLTENDFHLEVVIPDLSKNSFKSDPVKSTLYLNKLSRSCSVLDKAILKNYDNSLQSQQERNLRRTPTKKAELPTRKNMKEMIWDEIQKKKSKNLSFEEIQMRFRQTSFEDLNLEQRKSKKAENKEEGEKALEKTGTDPAIDQEREEIKKRLQELENEEENLSDSLILSGEDEDGDEEGDEEEEGPQGEQDDEKSSSEKGADKGTEGQEAVINQDAHNDKKGDSQHDASLGGGSKEENGARGASDNEQMQIEEERAKDPAGEIEQEKRSRVFKKLKKKAAEALERKQKEEDERKRQEKRQELKKQKRELLQNLANKVFFDKEAEEGSDNEDHDDVVKMINRKEEEEEEKKNGSDLDQDLKGLIDDDVVSENEDHENELWMKFQNDLMKKDKEELKRVINGAYNLRKRGMNEEDLFHDESRRKKLRMIEERLRYLEQQDEGPGAEEDEEKEKEERTSLFGDDEDEGLKAKEYQRNMKNEISKILMAKKPEEIKTAEGKLSLGDDDSVSALSKLSSVINNPLALKHSKSVGTNDRVGVVKKNSVLGAKLNNQNISLFNSNFNKDVINDYGFKSTVFESKAGDAAAHSHRSSGKEPQAPLKESKSIGNPVGKSFSFAGANKKNGMTHTPTKGSSLNKLLGNKQQNEQLFRPSPFKGNYFQKH